MTAVLPSLPVRHKDFVQYIKSHQTRPIQDLVKPYNEYDASARRIFAQDPAHNVVKDDHANIVPLYDEKTRSTDIRIQARDLESESNELKDKYILPLSDDKRRAHGSPAVVPTLSEFENNFTLFTEGALSEMDWSNVVAAGSAVVTSLLPVPEEYRNSKRGLRQYYHDEFAPASDVDLFLYGLTEEEAIEKIKHIEDKIRNTILYETTTIRTKNTITIASQYPTRHVQIVLRIYHSIGEILTGFDVDCSCAAYDGHQVYASPRAIASYITQTNQIDMTRRSPSYENRLSKYSHRGFEVFWPQLERSRVDPTIFERSFMRTEGLARLLVLEKLPKPDDRDNYLRKRREERGRPPLSVYLQRRQGKELRGNIKDDWEDEVPEWQEEDQISDYHTFTIPYGRRFNARKIEKLLYTKDLLLNAQWNQKKDRTVYLHRHPAFFGDVEHVIGDCCGFCPKPVTDEERKVAEEESKIYISGDVSFIKDNPGRQEIGSFNPITETNWTEMAYVGRTELLCQAIVSHDLAIVRDFLGQEDSDPDRRDYTGRTPLQLACMTSTPEIVQCLVDHGARLIARMADGQTALHLAAARGATEIVRILLTKSNENEEKENGKNESTKTKTMDMGNHHHVDDDAEKDDHSHTSASYVKIDQNDTDEVGPTFDTIEENELDPDIYDINVTAWDNLASPLHLAILHGHVETVKELVTSFGADVLMPIKITSDYNKQPRGAIMTLVLLLALPLEKARKMAKTLLKLGASSTQADMSHNTPLHYIAQSEYNELLDIFQEHDGPAMQRAINHLVAHGDWYSSGHTFVSAFVTAILAKNQVGAMKLLEMGANCKFEISECLKTLKIQMPDAVRYGREEKFVERQPKQPIFFAIQNDLPSIAIDLLRRGIDPNTFYTRKNDFKETVLDCTNRHLKELQDSLKKEPLTWYKPYGIPDPVIFEEADDSYWSVFQEETYQRFAAKGQLEKAKRNNERAAENDEQQKAKESEEKPEEAEARKVVTELIADYESLKAELISREAKTWEELHPGEQQEQPRDHQIQRNQQKQKPTKPFKVEFFRSSSGLSDVIQEGYVQLFEAAWNGDLGTIKSLALNMWGQAKDQLPLHISTTDSLGLNCLQICILKGHLHVAKVILQILRVQYKVKETDNHQHFEMNIDSENESSDDEGLDIVGHTVDDRFTYHNVGEAVSQVESEVSPLQALEQICPVELFLDEGLPPKERFPLVNMSNTSSWYYLRPNTLFTYAIFKNDVRLLEWLVNAGHECVKSDSSHEKPFSLDQKEFQLAISLGHTECLGLLMRSTGVGLPLMKLSNESGIAAREEPQYYQGLSIRGQKRKDWADAGRQKRHNHSDGPSRPPLLISALQGSLASTEWFLSTAPSRYYLDYVNAHLEDENVKRVAKSALGLDATVLKWLQSRNDLVLHCAVMARPSEESERLVQYLVDHHPECLEVRSSEGHTPLALSISLHRIKFAQILIKAGANQTVRDTQGCNLLHLATCSIAGGTSKEPENIKRLVDLMDGEQVSVMLTQRAGESSQTPFARWLSRYPFDLSNRTHRRQHDDTSEMNIMSSITRLFLAIGKPSNQKFLELLDGTGNTPIHDCVKRGLLHVMEAVFSQRLDLLYRENAMGNTPLDMAVDSWVNETTRAVPKVSSVSDGHRRFYSSNNRRPEQFLKRKELQSQAQMVVEECQKWTAQGLQKRRLVTLFEANEVAKRLATKGVGREQRYSRRELRRLRRGSLDSDSDENLDEVALWTGLASRWS